MQYIEVHYALWLGLCTYITLDAVGVNPFIQKI
jgi:hypothetical protein